MLTQCLAGRCGRHGLQLVALFKIESSNNPAREIERCDGTVPNPDCHARDENIPHAGYPVFCQTDTWLLLSPVKGSRFQPLQRWRSGIPARRVIRSSSDGHR